MKKFPGNQNWVKPFPWFVWFLPTHKASDGDEYGTATIWFKRFRGTTYVVKDNWRKK